MRQRSRTRLVVLQVLVVSMMVTLLGRLLVVQVHEGGGYVKAAAANRTREILTPATRGLVLDSRGRALARNRTALTVSIDRAALVRASDEGRGLIGRLATILQRPARELWGRTRLCGAPDAPRRPACWNGSPAAAIPLAENADPAMALQIMERREAFPGVLTALAAVRVYPAPLGANAAHELGYLGSDLVGRSGLEQAYDVDLRGTGGVRTLAVDRRGAVTGTVTETRPRPGNHLVTTLDAAVQAAAERELSAAVQRARHVGDVNKGFRRFTADSGAVVVMDVHTGGIVAMASWPTYDPNVWVGGISTADYRAITSKANDFPNQSRAFQGQFAPGSTFKAISVPAAVDAGYSLDGSYPCPAGYPIGGTVKSNYESEAFGTISMRRALEVSCDTVFYKLAYETWLRQGGLHPPAGRTDPFTAMAQGFGLGRRTGVDLPGEASGRIADRAWKAARWTRTKAASCAKAATGYPEVARTDPARASFLRRLARENCADGWAYRGGDAANFAIGQGDTLVTPLQLARVYAAVANGGTLVTPHLGKAIVTPAGKLVRAIEPRAAGRVPTSAETLTWLRGALRSVTEHGTARAPFARAGFPIDQVPVAAKTGTAEVFGKQSTSWFASFAPADKPQYAVVLMVTQGGTGSGTAGPSVAGLYRTLFGVNGRSVDLVRADPPGGHPVTALPVVRGDGSVEAP